MLIKVNLKDAARLGDLNIERFLAFVKGENALLRPAAACTLVESTFDPKKLEYLVKNLPKSSKPSISLSSSARKKDDKMFFLKGRCAEKIRDSAPKINPLQNPPLAPQELRLFRFWHTTHADNSSHQPSTSP